MNDININLPESSVDCVNKVGEELFVPAARSIGNNIGLFLDGIFGFLGSWGEKQKIKQQYAVEQYRDRLVNRVKEIPESIICEPELNIIGPALEASKYYVLDKTIQDLFIELIASDCDINKKEYVHPSFIEIIKQLSSEEAKLLKGLKCDPKNNYPIVDLVVVLSDGNGEIAINRNYSLVGKEFCDYPDNICKYLENLDRLKLIEVVDDKHITIEDVYLSIESSEYIKEKQEEIELDSGEAFECKRKCFHITDFGASFMKCCGLE